MSDDSKQNGPGEEFEALLMALGSGEITAGQRARLSEIVESDAGAREDMAAVYPGLDLLVLSSVEDASPNVLVMSGNATNRIVVSR